MHIHRGAFLNGTKSISLTYTSLNGPFKGKRADIKIIAYMLMYEYRSSWACFLAASLSSFNEMSRGQ